MTCVAWHLESSRPTRRRRRCLALALLWGALALVLWAAPTFARPSQPPAEEPGTPTEPGSPPAEPTPPPAKPAPRRPPTPAEVAEAKRLFRAGARAYEAGKFAAAVKAFASAYELVARPTLRFSAAQALRRQYTLDGKLELLQRAVAYYREYLSAVPQGGRRLDAVKAIEEIQLLLSRQSVSPPPTDPADPGNPTPPAPRPAATTTLMVDSSVRGARVVLNDGVGVPVPLIKEVEPGAHRLRIVAPGYVTVERSVTVPPHAKFHPLDIKLDEQPAQLTFSGDEGAEVMVDGRRVGTTPMAAPVMLPSGEHHLVVGSNGYEIHAERLDLARGDSRAVEVDLGMTAQRISSWVLIATGAASTAVGVALALVATSDQSDAAAIEQLQENEQRALTVDERNAYNNALSRRDNFRRVAGITLGVGAAVGLLGGLLYAFDEPDLHEASLSDQGLQPQEADDEPAVSIGPDPASEIGAALVVTF